jgi:hypothetical protein
MRAAEVSPSSGEFEPERREPGCAKPILDPRDGDAADHVSSPKQKSPLWLLAMTISTKAITRLRGTLLERPSAS